jgi:hypothetical protein
LTDAQRTKLPLVIVSSVADLMDLDPSGRGPFLREAATGGSDRFVAHPHNSWLCLSQHYAAARNAHPTEGNSRHCSAQQSAQTKDPSHHSSPKKGQRWQREKAETRRVVTMIRSHIWSGFAARNELNLLRQQRLLPKRGSLDAASYID